MEKKNVLLIDDDKSIRLTLKMVLEMNGYNVELASNGREALDKLSLKKYDPNLILVDIMMPIMDGHEFLKAKSQVEGINKIPCVAMTAGDRLERSVGQGVISDTMNKPVDMRTFLSKVSSALSAKGA